MDLYSFNKKSLWDVIVFFLLFAFSLGIHEVGHALTLKNYGGECHEMGFLLFYGSPAFFVDSTDAYLFEQRKQRIWFSLAGCYAELLVCCIASYIWFFTLPGTAVHDLAFLVFLFAGISGLLMNMNPLIKLDGYFILEDLLGIEGLREESFGFISRWIKRNIFHLQAEEPAELTRRKKRIFVAYGSISLLYTLSLYTLIVLWIKNIYLESFGQIGWILFLLTLFFLFRKKLWEIAGFLRFFYLDKKEVLMRKKTGLRLGLIALALLLFVPASHIKISSEFVLEPAERAEVRSQADAFVDRVLVKENDSVVQGQTLANTRNDELSEKVQRIRSQLEILDREISQSASNQTGSEHQMKVREKERLLQEKNEAEIQAGKLILKSPIRGTVITPRFEDTPGSFAARGSLVCVVANLDQVRVQIPVREYDIDDVKIDQEVLLKFVAYPAKTFVGKVARISSAGAGEVKSVEGNFMTFNVDVVIENRDRKLAPGMKGFAKILGARHSLGVRMLRELARGIQSIVW